MSNKADGYYQEGCGRCSLFATPQCKVVTWREPLAALRQIMLASGLQEDIKWKHPTYTLEGRNVLLIGTTKQMCSLAFFKGSLLTDPDNLLRSRTENVQGVKELHFTTADEVIAQAPYIQELIQEAIALEKAGAKVAFKSVEQYKVPEELEQYLASDETLRKAFEALTPGRKKGYYYHISSAKQSSTRIARIEKYRDKILAGKGFDE